MARGRVSFLTEARWLNASRVNGYALIFLGLSIALMCVFLANWRAGSDFVSFWSAAKLALAGQSELVYDLPSLYRAQHTLGFRDVPFPYPPPYLLMVAPLGYFSYPVAYAIFIGGTLAAWALALRWAPNGLYAPAVAFPVGIVSALAGQNGLLTSACAIGALGLLPRRKLAAGVLIGLLIIKPQLAVLYPLALVAAGEWRAFAAAAATVIALFAACALVFGLDTLGASLAMPREQLALLGSPTVTLRMMQSVYHLGITLGAPAIAAAAVQTLAALGAAVAVWNGWRRTDDPLTRAAILFAAAPLATPYIQTYDLGILIVPIVWLAREGVRRGFAPWGRLGLVLLFLSPIPLVLIVQKVPLAPVEALGLLLATFSSLPSTRRAQPSAAQGQAAAGDAR